MDIQNLATEVSVFLSPFLPYLVLGAESAAKQIGAKFGEAALHTARSILDKLTKQTQSPKLNGAINALAQNPDDEDFQLVLAKAVKELLEASPELSAELISIVEKDESVQTILVDQGSKVRDISQRLSRPGRQETIIRGSEAENISQEQ